MHKKTLMAILGVVLAFALTACSGGAGSSSTPSASGGDAGDSATATAAQLNITFVKGVLGDPFYTTMECGIRDAAAKAGNVTLDVQGPTKWDASVQEPILAAVVAKKPDALIFVPVDSTALQAPLQQAAAGGLKIGLVDETVDDPSFAFTQVSSDNVGGGAKAFQAVKQLVPDGGKVMVLSTMPGVPTVDQRQQGFEDAVKADPNYDYVGVQYDQDDASKAASVVTAMLQKYPDLKAIFATNVYSAEGAATGLKQANKADQVKIVGYDASPDEVKALQEGSVQALIAQQPFVEGQQVLEQAVKAATGQTTTPTIQTSTTIITKDMLGTPAGDAAVYVSSCS
ncbi:MAG: ABC transporter substrate-binding protein [Propionibacteriaceae bacterium]|nr:ABC transporter substrate-binding protein [Propionibacteriaceae bacterium]